MDAAIVPSKEKPFTFETGGAGIAPENNGKGSGTARVVLLQRKMPGVIFPGRLRCLYHYYISAI